MLMTTLAAALAFGQLPPEKPVSDIEKSGFFKELAKWHTRGEFFTEEAIKKAARYTRVLLALTEKDLGKRDIYPFLALSTGLMGLDEPRQYGKANFSTIAHPTIKLAWAIGIFRAGDSSPEILAFLSKSLEPKKDTETTLAAMLGPEFEEFKQKIIRDYEAARERTIRLVKQHVTNAFPDYGGGFGYTNDCCVFSPGQILYAARPLKGQGELWAYNIAKGHGSRVVIPQPKEVTAVSKFGSSFRDPILSVNSGGDLLCRWTIGGNGDHGLAVLKKGAGSFIVKRVDLYLANSFVVADADGAWYLVRWSAGADFTVYQIDNELNLTPLGNFKGTGRHATRILDARCIAKGVLSFFWGDVVSGNHLRMRCVDFETRTRKWLHARELFRLDKFVSSASSPTVLQTKDGALHYLWRISEGADGGRATGLYYQAEADGRTTKIAGAHEYRAITVGDRIVVCYTLEASPEKVFFRVLHHGAPGPVFELMAAKGQKDNLWSQDLVLYAESNRLWFVNTLSRNTLYELEMVETVKR